MTSVLEQKPQQNPVRPLAAAPEWPPDCPPMPRTWSRVELDFDSKPMVGWFDPGQLARTGVQALLSSVFGAYADRREVQAALGSNEPFDYSDQEDIWFDYIADLGDGFDSTYAMARLLAKEKLRVSSDSTSVETERGRFLVLGGDQVYPTASKDEYHNRLVGPYRAALPWTQPPDHPDMFAIPGNHDWYDGLTSFGRLFCQGRWIGGWKTRQPRSYFAIKLAHNWWLWGTDVQLESDIDFPQLEYFTSVAKQMEPGSKIILATAEPSWTYLPMKGPTAYENIQVLEEATMNPYGHKHVIGLAGDLHTYARYESKERGDTRHRFISGGGGAYLYPTHSLPTMFDLPEQGKLNRYKCDAVFPSLRDSKRLSWRALLFPFMNPPFAFFMGALYLIVAWSLQSTSIILEGVDFGQTAAEAKIHDTYIEQIAHIPFVNFGRVIAKTWHYAAVSPTTMLLIAALVFGLYAFADVKGRWLKMFVGVGHALLHIAALVVFAWALAWLDVVYLKIDPHSFLLTLAFTAEMVLLGGAVGSMIMGLYLWLSNRALGAHTNEIFSCQASPDYKHFLRFHLTKDGLTIYPIGVKKVPRSWELWMDQNAGNSVKPGTEWIVPKREGTANRPYLIEEPIEMK
jgi:hypothetical protein